MVSSIYDYACLKWKSGLDMLLSRLVQMCYAVYNSTTNINTNNDLINCTAKYNECAGIYMYYIYIYIYH